MLFSGFYLIAYFLPPQESDKCFECNSQHPYNPYHHRNSHRIENVIYLMDRNGDHTWWQSVNGVFIDSLTIHRHMISVFTVLFALVLICIHYVCVEYDTYGDASPLRKLKTRWTMLLWHWLTVSSSTGQEDVSIRLNLEAEFHFTHLIMKFKVETRLSHMLCRFQCHELETVYVLNPVKGHSYQDVCLLCTLRNPVAAFYREWIHYLLVKQTKCCLITKRSLLYQQYFTLKFMTH